MYGCLVRAKMRVSSCNLSIFNYVARPYNCAHLSLCPGSFPFSNLPNGLHAAPVLPEITIGHS